MLMIWVLNVDIDGDGDVKMEMDIDIDVEEDGGGVDDEKRIGKRVEMSDALAVLWMDNS